MTESRDIGVELATRVRAAAEAGQALTIAGASTKAFYCGVDKGETLEVKLHCGIVSYEPTELVFTARAGTPLAEIEAILAEKNQMLAFEPPHYGSGSTLGGAIACGFSGPRRPYAGAARDFVLGTKIVNGKGEILAFGGQVMKNVAGYDVSRLICGSLGTLGVILEVSLKVLPRPELEQTLAFELDAETAIQRVNVWAGQPLPLSGACHSGERLYLRISGGESALKSARSKLGGELHDKGAAFWEDLKEQRLVFFKERAPLWRLSVPPAAGMSRLPGKWVIDWGGAQRWLKSDAGAGEIRAAARALGGHATLFRGDAADTARFPPLPAALQALHLRIKRALDPAFVLNPSLARSLIGSAKEAAEAA